MAFDYGSLLYTLEDRRGSNKWAKKALNRMVRRQEGRLIEEQVEELPAYMAGIHLLGELMGEFVYSHIKLRMRLDMYYMPDFGEFLLLPGGSKLVRLGDNRFAISGYTDLNFLNDLLWVKAALGF